MYANVQPELTSGPQLTLLMYINDCRSLIEAKGKENKITVKIVLEKLFIMIDVKKMNAVIKQEQNSLTPPPFPPNKKPH